MPIVAVVGSKKSGKTTAAHARALIHVLCRIRGLDADSTLDFKFESMLLGLKLNTLKRLISPFLTGKLVKGTLPDNLRISLRFNTMDIFVVKEIYFNDVYEQHYIPRSGDIIFDIGSHIGIFTLKASKLVGPTGCVYAFEPEPMNFTILRQNISLNNARNVRIFNKAISSQIETLRLNVDSSNTGGSSVQFLSRFEKGKTVQISISSTTLDQIMHEYDIQKVDFLKIDVEGHELEVLKGAGHFLDICGHVAVETHERVGGPSNTQIIESLRRHEFKTELINPRFAVNNDMIYGWK